MLETGCIIHVELTSAQSNGPLIAGVITETQGQAFTAEFVDPISPVAGAAVNIYYSIKDKQVRVPGKVQAFLQSQPRAAIRFHLTGEPVPAEGRGILRVKVAGAGLTIDIGDEKRCPLQDLSGDGFGALCVKKRKAQDTVGVVLATEGAPVSGQAVVRSVRDLGDGRFRCGFAVPESQVKLRQSLSRTCVAIQRERLRRKATRA